MSECENITMIKYKVDDEEFEDTIIRTFADWKSFQVNLQKIQSFATRYSTFPIDLTL
jgi:hypothetical protein